MTHRVIPLLATGLILAGCNNKPAAPAPGGQAGEPGPAAVKVASPTKQALAWVIEQPGTILPFEVTPLVAKLSGYVKAIAPDPKGKPGVFIDIGSPVKKDQVLATIDIPELVEEAAQKRALVEQAKAEQTQAEKEQQVAAAVVAAAAAMVKEAEAGIARADADVDRWKAEATQAEALVGKTLDAQSKAIIGKQLKTAEAGKAEAEAKVLSAKAVVIEKLAREARAVADVATAAAKVKVAEAELRRVEALVKYTEIRAPFDGIVTARTVHPGQFLQPTGNQNPVVFTVARLDIVRVVVDVPESAAAKAGAATQATVRVPALGNREFAGEVARTTGVIQPDTRTLRAEIDIENPDRVLKPGMYAFVQIRAESSEATVLPAASVLAADETHYVFLVEGGKAVKYRVQVGRTEGTNVQVIARRKATATTGAWEPFTGAERALVGNLGALTDGAAVEVKE